MKNIIDIFVITQNDGVFLMITFIFNVNIYNSNIKAAIYNN